MPSVLKMIQNPESPWGKPCDLCGEPDIESRCGGCGVGLHHRCSKEHLRECPLQSPNVSLSSEESSQ